MRKPNMRGRTLLAVLAALALTALVACSSKESPSGSGGTATETSGGGVAVTLDDYAIRPEVTTVPAGEVTFAIENVGATEHEMVVVRSDIDPTTIPVVDHAIDEEAPGMEPMGEVEEVQPGASTELVLTLEPGNYLLLCNIEKHFERGMVTTITVA